MQDADERSSPPAEPGPPVEATASGDTLPTSALLSRRSTDFGMGPDEPGRADRDPHVGRDLGGVVIERLLAQGGMGRVYAARQRSPDRTVAVKLMRPGRQSPAAAARFQREADLLGRLRHPGIAQVFLAGSCVADGDETPYFVMEFVPDAETLVQACERRGWDARRRLEAFLEICRAVAHGHGCGVVHRDLKPGNILIDGDGRPKVIDFGLAKLADERGDGGTETGEFLGTRRYSSPEQAAGEAVDARTDVYALGVILHELLTGKPPLDLGGKSLAETARILRDEPPARLRIADRGLAPGLDTLAGRCLAKRPGDRYASAADLAGDVQRLLAGLPITARRPGPFAAAGAWGRRHPAVTAGSLAAILSAAVVTAAVWLPVARGPAAGPGPTPRFPNISSLRTTPLQWLHVAFDEPVRSLSVADFRLTRDGEAVPLAGVSVSGGRDQWELRGLEQATGSEGRYVLELAGTATTPADLAGRRLAKPARVEWRMPPYREIALNLIGDEWRRHVVSMTDVECATERDAGSCTFIRPTVPNREGSIVMKFQAPFEIRAATLTATIAVWTTGDAFPYDPRAKAALDVSADGITWTNLDTREANRGGSGGGPFDIREEVAGSREVWVRARLTAERNWPGDGLIHAQFMRTDPTRPEAPALRLGLTGPDPAARRPPPGTPAADG